jgi:hypothetical protein
VTRHQLLDLARSQPGVSHASQQERERLLGQVEELYDDYGRGPDGMLMPLVTTALRTASLPWADTAGTTTAERHVPLEPGSPEIDDSLLIDFR